MNLDSLQEEQRVINLRLSHSKQMILIKMVFFLNWKIHILISYFFFVSRIDFTIFIEK